MTVENTINRVTRLGNDVATSFSFTFEIFESGDLEVTLVEADGTETLLSEGTGSSNYSVAPTTEFPGTGSITYPASGGSPLPTGDKLVLRRVLSLLQLTDLENQGGYFPDTQEEVYDRLVMIAQQQQEELDRSVKVTVGSDTDPADLITDLEADAAAAAASAAAASSSETNAAASEAAALNSQNKAERYSSLGQQTVANAFGYMNDAQNSASAAANSEANAQSSQIQASKYSRSAGAAFAAAHDAVYRSQNAQAGAETAEANAAASEAAAGVSETNAAASEAAAGVSETNAAASEAAAGVSETNAAASEAAAGVSETNAAASEAAAGVSETNAAASAAAAAASAASVDTSSLILNAQVFS